MNRRQFIAGSVSALIAPDVPIGRSAVSFAATDTIGPSYWYNGYCDVISIGPGPTPEQIAAMNRLLREKWFPEEVASERRYDAWCASLGEP